MMMMGLPFCVVTAVNSDASMVLRFLTGFFFSSSMAVARAMTAAVVGKGACDTAGSLDNFADWCLKVFGPCAL